VELRIDSSEVGEGSVIRGDELLAKTCDFTTRLGSYTDKVILFLRRLFLA